MFSFLFRKLSKLVPKFHKRQITFGLFDILTFFYRALDFEKSEMDKTIKGLYQSALKMRQSKSVDCFDSEVDEKTVTEVVNFVENEITEFHQDL